MIVALVIIAILMLVATFVSSIFAIHYYWREGSSGFSSVCAVIAILTLWALIRLVIFICQCGI